MNTADIAIGRFTLYFLPTFILSTLAGGVAALLFSVLVPDPKAVAWATANYNDTASLGAAYASPLAFVFGCIAAKFRLRPIRLAGAQLIGAAVGIVVAIPFGTEPMIWLDLMGQFFGGAIGCGWARSIADVRRGRGQCIACGYNLTGLTERRCPECGTPFAEQPPRARKVTRTET